MSIEALLNHTCDIFHLIKSDNDMPYNLPASVSFSYPDIPDAENVACHFGVKSFTHSIKQNTPANEYESRIKLTLPIGTDIRRNDKIIEKSTGDEYTAEQPRNIRNHHIFVYIKRTTPQKPL